MKNIIVVVADSLRRDTSKEIVKFPDTLPHKEYEVKSCNSCTELSMPWMLSGMETFSQTMSIPTDMKRLGYSTTIIHSNPVVGRFSGPFDSVVDLASKDPVKHQLKRFNRLTRHIPNWIFKRIRSNNKYLPYARVKDKLTALKKLPTSKPMFTWIHLMDPHTPYYPEVSDMKLENIIELNRNQMSAVRGYRKPSESEVEQWYELYKLESAGMYWHILEFLGEVDYEATTVILTSDHGEEFGEHGHYGHKGNRFNPENVEVPFIVFGEDINSVSIQSHKTLRNLIRRLS